MRRRTWREWWSRCRASGQKGLGQELRELDHWLGPKALKSGALVKYEAYLHFRFMPEATGLVEPRLKVAEAKVQTTHQTCLQRNVKSQQFASRVGLNYGSYGPIISLATQQVFGG